jgi:Txe/YoeB family toxin of Txe-Axe toxin-antitoxin module
MGRVAKYKKIKSCDPFSKKNGGKQSMLGIWGLDDNGRRAKKRSATARNLKQNKFKKQNRGQEEDMFDLPPTEGDDFDLSDILRIKKIKPPALELLEETKFATNTVTVVPKYDSDVDKTHKEIVQDPMLEEKRVNRILKIKPDRPNIVKKVERFPGESRKAFERRIKSETRQLIRNEELQRHNPEKRQRKKEFLNKKKKMRGKSQNDSGDGDNDYRVGVAATLHASDGFVTGEQAVARMALGDQVERPPVFNQLPRGASVKVKMTTSTNLSQNKNESIAAEQKAMENMRRKAQAQYALVKAKRRKAGDFHL